ncbi:hypothetical protein Tco_1481427, partial [Tanacetum coccineum]
DEEEVSSDDNEMVEVKVLMALVEDDDVVSKEGVDQLTKDPSSSGQKDLVFVKSLADDTKVSIPGVERPWLSKAEGSILPNHDTGRILQAESQRNTTNPSVAVTDSSATKYDSADESLICSTPLPPLKKLDGDEPISRPNTIKSILKSKSTFKAETLKGVIIMNHLQLLLIVINVLQLQKIISLKREIKPKNIQHVLRSYETCGRTVHTTTGHNDIEWFRRGEELQAKKAKTLKSTKAESSNANRSKTPTKRWASKTN